MLAPEPDICGPLWTREHRGDLTFIDNPYTCPEDTYKGYLRIKWNQDRIPEN